MRDLQARWQLLDKAQGASSKGLWERFRRACDRAYAPARKHFEELEKQRSENVEKKSAVLEKLAALGEHIVDGADWGKILNERGELVKAWFDAGALPRRPRIFFEEWDVPHISAIRWVSELLTLAGGDDCFPELATQSLGKNRIIADGAQIVQRNPDIIIGSWCGKKFRPEKVAARPGWEQVAAVRNGQLFEIKSADILQPGPAALTDGAAQLHRIVMNWSALHG